MWIMDSFGRFYSAVEHNNDSDLVVVRARVIKDAEQLAWWVSENEGFKHDVLQFEGTDYPARVIMTKLAWARYLVYAAQNVTYGNYKNHVKDLHGAERANIFSSVWTALLRLERFNPKAQRGIYASTWFSDELDDLYFSESSKPAKKRRKKKKKVKP